MGWRNIAVSPYAAYNTRTADLLLLWLPTSFVSSGGIVTSITDHGQGTPTIQIFGSPALGSANGLNGLVLDGVNDYALVTGFSASDQALTVLALIAPASANLGDYGSWIEFSDGATADRSAWFFQAYTSQGARAGQNAGGTTASYAYNSTSLALFRATFRTTSRSIHQDGVWKDSMGNAASPARTVTRAYVGRRPDGTKFGKGTLCALAVYAGVPDARELQRIEGALLDMAGIARPWAFSDIGAVSAPVDPLWLVDGRVAHALVGEKFRVFKYAPAFANGDFGLQAKILTSGKYFDRSFSDRWEYTPAAAGDTEIRFYSGGSGGNTATLTVRAWDVPVGQPNVNVWILGDSRINRAGSGWAEIVKTRLGSQVTFVGSLGPNSNYTVKHNGRDSWTTQNYVDQAGRAGTPSDLYNGGMSPDVTGLFATFTAQPDVAVINLGLNDLQEALATSKAAAIAAITSTIIPNLDTIVGWIHAARPGIPILILCGEPLAADPACHGGAATRDNKHELVHRYARALLDHTWAANVYPVLAFYLGTDPNLDYSKTDSIHTVASPGHEHHASAVIAVLAAYAY